MTTEALKELDVGRIAHRDAALFMWATDAHIPDAGIDHVGEHKVHHPIVAAEGDGAVDALLDELPQSGFLFVGENDAVHSVHASTSP